jgi:hypothetical protein
MARDQRFWVEVLLVGAAMMAMAEQLRVADPGIDNRIEAILMAPLLCQSRGRPILAESAPMRKIRTPVG